MLRPLNPPIKTAYPLMISLFSPLMKYSCSGVMIHSEFFWPVRGSASTTSVQRFMFTVPWGKVLGWKRKEKKNLFGCNKTKYKFPVIHRFWSDPVKKDECTQMWPKFNKGCLSHWFLYWISDPWVNTDITSLTFQQFHNSDMISRKTNHTASFFSDLLAPILSPSFSAMLHRYKVWHMGPKLYWLWHHILMATREIQLNHT